MFIPVTLYKYCKMVNPDLYGIRSTHEVSTTIHTDQIKEDKNDHTYHRYQSYFAFHKIVL